MFTSGGWLQRDLPELNCVLSKGTTVIPSSMRLSLFALSAALFAASGCQETAAPVDAPVFRVTATILETNECVVSALGKTYESQGQVRGDTPSQFIGTEKTLKYHGFGCAVFRQTRDADGDIIVLFSQNNFGKPLEPGTYKIVSEIVDETPAGYASVRFNSSDFPDWKLNSMDNLAGSVKVEATPAGGRKITVDVEMIQWGEPF